MLLSTHRARKDKGNYPFQDAKMIVLLKEGCNVRSDYANTRRSADKFPCYRRMSRRSSPKQVKSNDQIWRQFPLGFAPNFFSKAKRDRKWNRADGSVDLLLLSAFLLLENREILHKLALCFFLICKWWCSNNTLYKVTKVKLMKSV